MKKLSKEKRDQLVVVGVATAVTLSGIWFGLIKFQEANLRTLANKKKTAEKKLAEFENLIRNRNTVEAELAKEAEKLAELEENMVAPGDQYSWMVSTIQKFKSSYKIDIPQFSTVVAGDMNMIPLFPYKQVSMQINGTAHFHELGKFIADFENRFPQIRIQNLDISPISSPAPGDQEKLTFKMDIVALIRSGKS